MDCTLKVDLTVLFHPAERRLHFVLDVYLMCSCMYGFHDVNDVHDHINLLVVGFKK